MEAKQATLHHELIAQLLDSRIPKTEREHAAAREIERLRADLLQELVEAPEPEPVLVVETEPGYWTRGHYCEGTKSYIDPTKVWGLPVGTKLYTAPPAPSVPETEPVAYATGYYAGCLSIATIDGRVLPTGTALYAAPPHQSEQHLEMVNTPARGVDR